MAEKTVAVRLSARVDQYVAAMKAAQSSTTGFSRATQRNLQQVGTQMQTVGRSMTTFITAPLAVMGVVAVKAASDLNESMSKVNVVFGDSADAVLDWSETSADAFGQSQQQALEAAGTFGNLFTTMGVGQQDAAALSIEMVQLASDLASFNNVPIEEALVALRAGLVGEIEPLRRFGVSINAAVVEAKAMELGLVDVNGVVTESGKVQARYALIMENTTNAQGDFARTSDQLANQQRILVARFGDMSAELGGVLLPIALQVVGAVSHMVSFFADLPGPVQAGITALAGLAATIGPLVFLAGSFVKNFVALRGSMATLGPAAAATSKALGALTIAAGTAIAVWDILGEGHLNAGANIDSASDALIRTTSAAFAESVAAGEAAAQVDSLAIAHKALSLAISEAADDDLSRALTDFNIAADETLDVLTDLRADEIGGAIELIQQRFGVGVEAALFFWEEIQSGSGDSAAAMQIFADQVGVTVGEVEAASEDLNTLTQFAIENGAEVAALADVYLDAQVQLGGVAREAVMAAQAIAGNREVGLNAIAVYEEFVRILAEMQPAQRDAILANNDMTASLVGLGPEAVTAALGIEDLTAEQLSAAEGADALADSFTVLVDGIASGNHKFIQGAAIVDDWASAWLEATGIMTDSAFRLADAEIAVWENTQQLGEGLDSTTAGFDLNSEAGRTNRQVLIDAARGILDHAQAWVENGGSINEATGHVNHNIDALLDQVEALGFDRAAAEDLLAQLGLMPEEVKTTVTLAGALFMQQRIEDIIDDLGGIPPEVVAEVSALLNSGDIEGAYRYMLDWQQRVQATSPTVRVRVVSPIVQATVSTDGRTVSVGTVGYAVAARHGAYIGQVPHAGIPAVLHSDEAVLPLSDPARMSAILGLSQVGPRVAAAMAGMWGGGSSGGGGDTYNVNVYNNGRELTSGDVARAIQMARLAS